MTKYPFAITFIFFSIFSIYSQHKIKETFSEKFIPPLVRASLASLVRASSSYPQTIVKIINE